jgi:hypothetical protein
VNRLDGLPNFETGLYNGNAVLLDSKIRDNVAASTSQISADPAISPDAKDVAMNQLVTVLRSRWQVELAIPECLCWMSRPNAASLVFRIPQDLHPRPHSLFHALSDTLKSTGPPLEARLRVAHSLAAALDVLHSVSYVHKNIRSKNILFYYTKSSVEKPVAVESKKIGPHGVDEDDDNEEMPLHWYLYGFEYARHMDTKSSLGADGDLHNNTYRHPERLGAPSKNFDPIHDIYALGVVLLELGTWHRATEIARLRGTTAMDGQRLRNRLIAYAEKHLGFMVGVAYQDVVLRCLRGDFGVEIGEDVVAKQRLGERFRALVVERLQAAIQLRADSKIPAEEPAWTVEEISEEDASHGTADAQG